MALSLQARDRFAHLLERIDPARSSPVDDEEVVAFAVWGFMRDPSCLDERSLLDLMMIQRGVTAGKRGRVLAVLGATTPLLRSFEHLQTFPVVTCGRTRPQARPTIEPAGAPPAPRVEFPPGRARRRRESR